MLERWGDDNDEFWMAGELLGRHRFPSPARIDPSGDTTRRGDAEDEMVRQLERSDLALLTSGEREVVATLA
ncbi:hypothetical protein ACWEPR_27115 [Streptomyces sp. NPDC004290]